MPKFCVHIIESIRIARSQEFEAENEDDATQMAYEDDWWCDWPEDDSSTETYVDWVEKLDD